MKSKTKTTVTFHSGILAIGGTVIEVAHKNAHIFFDFDTEFRPELDSPDDHTKTLTNSRLVPELKDLYDPRLGYEYYGTEDKEYQYTAVFLSHAHLDHSRMINYLDPAVPLHTLKETKMILNSLGRKGDFLTSSPFEEKNFIWEMIGLNRNGAIKVGKASMEIVPVDHDAYGASALLIYTPDHFITYTGGSCLHGHNREEILAFCEKVKHTELLIMEGANISLPEREPDPVQIAVVSEEDFVQHLIHLELENPNWQTIFNGYPANVERFARIIEKSLCTAVLEANMAVLLLEVFGMEVRYYYAESGRTPELNPALEIPYDALLKDKTDYLWQVVNQFDNPQEGSLYIHSDAQPLRDFDPQCRMFLDSLARKDITLARLACSGHAIPEDLDKITTLTEPQVLVPIHTLKPEKLENPYGERILPGRDEQIVL